MISKIAFTAASVFLLAACADGPSMSSASPAAPAVSAAAAPTGPAVSMANAHFQTIASGDVSGIAADYAPDARLEWIGGPLDGSYRGPQIAETWGKFAKAQGKLDATVSDMRMNANPKGSTVGANVSYKGQNQIKVRQVVTYRDGKIVNEIWQIDPNLPG